MFDVLIARTLNALDHLNTLAMPTARVRFQICPGDRTGSPTFPMNQLQHH
jgi:hypothetical protein